MENLDRIKSFLFTFIPAVQLNMTVVVRSQEKPWLPTKSEPPARSPGIKKTLPEADIDDFGSSRNMFLLDYHTIL
jgi:hypothetical protein